MKTTQSIVEQLLDRIVTTVTFKQISDQLEDLAQDEKFKSYTDDIVADPNLTDNQKINQLMYVFKDIDIPLLYDFFSEILDKKTLFLFSTGKIDYFDKFVQEFQLMSDNIGIVNLTTSIKLSNHDAKAIADDLSKAFGYKVILNLDVDPKILGGAQVKVENLIFDYSLRTKFKQFEHQWLKTLEKTQKKIKTDD